MQHLLSWLACLCCVSASWAQAPSAWTEAASDQVYGLDDFLVNGKPYTTLHSGAKGEPFLITADWMEGTVFIHEHAFANCQLRFDLEKQVLVLLQNYPDGRSIPVELSPHLIDSFDVGGLHFLRADHAGLTGFLPGFAEPLYRGNFQVYRTYSKHFLANYQASTPRGSFSKAELRYALHNADGSWAYFSSVKALFRQFPQHKKAIRKAIRDENIPLSEARAADLSPLLTLCDAPVSTP